MGHGRQCSLSTTDVCTSTEASDAQICHFRVQPNCFSCTNLAKGNSAGMCECHVDDETQRKWCHTGGCVHISNNVCGATTTSTCDADAGQDSYTVGFPSSPLATAIPDGTNTSNATPSASGGVHQKNSLTVMMFVLAVVSMLFT